MVSLARRDASAGRGRVNAALGTESVSVIGVERRDSSAGLQEGSGTGAGGAASGLGRHRFAGR